MESESNEWTSHNARRERSEGITGGGGDTLCYSYGFSAGRSGGVTCVYAGQHSPLPPFKNETPHKHHSGNRPLSDGERASSTSTLRANEKKTQKTKQEKATGIQTNENIIVGDRWCNALAGTASTAHSKTSIAGGTHRDIPNYCG